MTPPPRRKHTFFLKKRDFGFFSGKKVLYLGTELQFAGCNVGIHWCALVLTGVCIKYGVFWEKTHFLMKNTRFFLKNTILGGQIQKIENIEGFRVFKTLKMLNIHNTSGFTPKTIVVLSSRCTRLPISAPQGQK